MTEKVAENRPAVVSFILVAKNKLCFRECALIVKVAEETGCVIEIASGNKALLEKRINIRASDYRFADKKKYYTGDKRNGKNQHATCNVELIRIANTHSDFTERDILERNEEIIDAFIAYLDAKNFQPRRIFQQQIR